MENMMIELEKTKKINADEFGQGQYEQVDGNIRDIGKLRSFLNSVSDYSKNSPEPSALYEGQGSNENK